MTPNKELYLLDDPPKLDLSKYSTATGVQIHLTHVDTAGVIWSAQQSVDAIDYANFSFENLLASILPTGFRSMKEFYREYKDPAHLIGQPAGGRNAPREFKVSVVSTDGYEIDTGSFKQTRVASDIQAYDIVERAVAGRAHIPSLVRNKSCAILVLTSNAGGVEQSFAPLLASKGFYTFAAAHFNYPGRPSKLEAIDLEFFRDVSNWMRREFGVDHIYLQGSSSGGELALILAANFPDCFDGVAAQSAWHAALPTSIDRTVSPWRISGRELEAFPIREYAGNGSNDECLAHMYKTAAASVPDDHPSVTPVESIRGPIFLAAGSEDSYFGSPVAIKQVEKRRSLFRCPSALLKSSIYAGAGHYLAPPGLPTKLCDRVFLPTEKRFIALGGTSSGALAGSRQLWLDLLNFFNEAAR